MGLAASLEGLLISSKVAGARLAEQGVLLLPVPGMVVAQLMGVAAARVVQGLVAAVVLMAADAALLAAATRLFLRGRAPVRWR
jgi:hypothetical protein